EHLVQRPQLVRRARSVGSAAGAVRSGARSGQREPPSGRAGRASVLGEPAVRPPGGVGDADPRPRPRPARGDGAAQRGRAGAAGPAAGAPPRGAGARPGLHAGAGASGAAVGAVGVPRGGVRAGERRRLGPPPRLIRRRYSDLTEYAETQQFCWRIRECRHFRMPTQRKTSPIPLSVTPPPLISPPMAILNPPRRIHRALTAGLVPAAAAVLLL